MRAALAGLPTGPIEARRPAALALGVSGLFLLAAGIAALALGQPYAVWYPLVLLGVLDPALGFGLLPVVRRRFEKREH